MRLAETNSVGWSFLRGLDRFPCGSLPEAVSRYIFPNARRHATDVAPDGFVQRTRGNGQLYLSTHSYAIHDRPTAFRTIADGHLRQHSLVRIPYIQPRNRLVRNACQAMAARISSRHEPFTSRTPSNPSLSLARPRTMESL